VLYILTIVAHLFSFEISYRIVKVRPEIVKVRDLTYAEHKGLERAQRIRNNIGRALLYFSLVITIISGLIWYFKPYEPTTFVKVLFFVGLFWTILLKIVQGIHFIPLPPIR
jgi:hypothetical protein